MKILGIGSEIVECLRIAQMIERHGEDFLRRIYSSREIEYCSSRKSATQHYAARWAGKHAVMRALGVTTASVSNWRDVELRPQASGEVKVAFGGDLRQLCLTRGVGQLFVSIAHCRSHATGYALAMKEE